jgi:hypothetical protein
MLVKYREELARPIQEATEFFKSVETQLDSITGASACFLLSKFGACRIGKCFFGLWHGREQTFLPLWIHAVLFCFCHGHFVALFIPGRG